MPKKSKITAPSKDILKKERDLVKEEYRLTEQEKVLEATYGDDEESEQTLGNSKEDQDDWEQLRGIAKVQFPEGIEHTSLSPKNRLVAIATCLGWTQDKISKASGLSMRTVSRWLTRSDIKVFMDEFNMKRGNDGADVMTKFTELEYKAVTCVNGILSNKNNSDSAQRLKLDAAKWVFERKRGKAAQPIEHRGENIKSFMTMLSNLGKDFKIDSDEEKDIFETASRETH